jgi:hypothetical protein
VPAVALWPASYRESRQWFRDILPQVLRAWPGALLASQPLSAEPELTIDWLYAEPAAPARLLVLTTGLHGIEGFVGAVILRLFVEEFLPRLEAASTGLLLIHALNPWGMHHGRKVNAHNVDLNRNFLLHAEPYDPDFNGDYKLLRDFLGPRRPLDAPPLSVPRFLLGLARAMKRHGAAVIQRAALLGQYGDPKGMYYGGGELAEESRLLIELLQAHVRAFAAATLLDIHCGYGPPRQMSLVHSTREPRPADELRRRFGYPHVLKSDDRDFFAMRGDMIDSLYGRAGEMWPRTRLYASAFEFGTLGDSTLALARSLRAMVHENQAHHHGARTPSAMRWARREFEALYVPHDPDWWRAARESARRAFDGILGAEGFLRP